MVMDDMKAVYDDETNNSGYGLMSLLRAPIDLTLDPYVSDNFGSILDMASSAQIGFDVNPSEDFPMLEEMENAPNVSELLEGYGIPYASEIATAASLAGGIGGKLRATGDGFDDLIERIKKLAQENRNLKGEQDMELTRQENDPDLPELYKSFDRVQREDREKGLGSLTPMEGDNDIDKALASLRKTMDDNPKPFVGASQAFGKLSNEGKQRIQGILNRRNKIKGEIDQDMFMDSDKVSQMMRRLESFNEQLRPYYPDIDRMASGGRPGLYANINAKRKRIAAGSGETMRKKGAKGAPTAANFRESAKTAKKANGGGLSYMNGYYGKSYK